jgi:hypothetical protein
VPNAGTKIKTGKLQKGRKVIGLTRISPTLIPINRRVVISLTLVILVREVTHDLRVKQANPSIRKVIPTTLRGWVRVVRVLLALPLQ